MGNGSDWLESFANAYYDALSLIDDEDFIASEFPSYSDPNFSFLMENIADRFLRDVDDYEQFYKDESSSENLELLEVSKRKLRMVKEALLDKKNSEVVMTGKKNLIFALRGSDKDKSYALSDLGDIPREYYSKYASMFRTLIDGSESYDSVHHKVATGNNEKNAGLKKIKDFKTRLLYLSLDNDTVFVIGCYNKYSDNDIKSRNFEINRLSSVSGQYQYCKKMIDAGKKEELVNVHIGYLQEIGDNLGFVVEGGKLDERSRTK